MTTLTSSLGWTASTNNSIEVKVFSSNSDGQSTTGTQITNLAANSTNYFYAPQVAPTISASASGTTTIDVLITCLTNGNAGWFDTSYSTTYSVLYRVAGSTNAWTDKNVTCSSGTTTAQLTGLTSVSTY